MKYATMFDYFDTRDFDLAFEQSKDKEEEQKAAEPVSAIASFLNKAA